MQRAFLSALKVTLFILFTVSAAPAIDSPHTSNLGCIDCHLDIMNAMAGTTGVNNLCLTCHNPATMDKAFSPKDLANPFGSTVMGVYTAGRVQTSHNWAAPTNVPEAGAAAPVDPVMANLKATKQGIISCASCHDQHAAAGGNLLRKPNKGDVLCFDCHRSRNQRSHLTGTHPVNLSYTSATSKVKLKPADYYASPLNANPANPTSAMKLPDGLLLCSTCHGVHFTDSNSLTLDNYSSSNFGKLTPSRGYLLRTDMRGAAANEINICTNCHKNKASHNYKGQNIQCADCHAGHVDTGDGTVPNVWLVRRYMNYSGGVQLSSYRSKVLFQYTGAKRNLAGPFGVCQACHGIPTGDNYPSEHLSTDPNICASCHSHNTSAGSFSGGCTTCHGFPPHQNTPGGPDGYGRTGSYDYSSTPAFKDEANTGHFVHAGKVAYSFKCAECHAGNKHASGNFQQVFQAKTGLAATAGAIPMYNTTNPGTCSATYCHSNGAPRGKTLISKPVAWANTRGTIVGNADGCVACHGGVTTSFNNLSTNSHFRHISRTALGKGYTCDICHAATASSNTAITDFANHVNGLKEVSFSGQAAGSTWNGATATCITYCHSNGGNLALRVYFSPDWTKKSSGACGTCHSATPYITGGSLINSNGHFAHFSSSAKSYGPMLSQVSVSGCRSCHISANDFGLTHVDGAIQVSTTCSPCHNQAGKYAWTAGTVSCESCHTGALSQINGITAPDKSQFETIGHGKFAGKSDQCLSCHVRSDRHISAKEENHVTRLGSSYLGINQNILCANCHNNQAIVTAVSRQNMATHVLGKGATPTPSSCSACHDVHGTTNLSSINKQITYKPLSTATISFTNISTGFINNKTNLGLCQVCHTRTNHFKRGVVEAGHPTKRCLACHDHKASYAFKPNGNCNTCHGYPPVASMVGIGTHNNYSSALAEVVNSGGYINGGGAHSVAAHVSSSAQWDQTWDNCANCHDPNRHLMMMPVQQNDINVTIDKMYWTNSTIPATYTGPLNGTGTGVQSTGSCSNLYCHSNGNGAAPNNTTFTWSSPKGTLGCTGCHGNNSTSGKPIATGKHSAHINPLLNPSLGAGNELGCVECHAKTVDTNTHISKGEYHVNRFKDYSGQRAGSYNAVTKQCANVYCHSNGNAGALVYTNPPAWDSTVTFGCNGCHGSSNSIGAPDYANGGAGKDSANSHNAHTGGAETTGVCSDCHFLTASTTAGKLRDNSAHLNKTVNVNFNPAVAGASASYDPVTGLCSNIACHGNGSAQWGSKAGCLACHSLSIGNRAAIGPQFSGKSHHIQGTDLTGAHCYQCHWEANSDGTINRTYHHSSTPGGPVELVIYGAGARPTTYAAGTTAIQYTANGSRSEMAKINSHCVGCHSDQNKTTQPFSDGKSPSVYAWDGSSIGAKFGDTGTTPWSKYSGNNVTPKNTVTKAFSAHGNVANNKGGWDTTETWKDRMASSNVLCFDCHNSHGSNVSGITTSYVTATINGGILKDIVAGKGGYPVTYQPAAGGSAADHNAYNAGAGLCFDCHMKATAGVTPWGYNTTFGSTQQIMGFADSPYFGPGTFGRKLQYSYKATPNMGGHFGASSPLSSSSAHAIGGLCTPCHDPHGVSPTLGTNKGYAVPMLKGTWVTSPYKEDVTTADNQSYVAIAAVGYTGDYEGPTRSQAKKDSQTAAMKSYKIDQNTFSTTAKMTAAVNGVTETDVQFAGLCLNCHAKETLTDGANHSWKDKNRIHESVKGWKTANATKQHNFTCSKCHAPHNASLPRLMVTNCLDSKHRGRTAFNAKSITSGSYRGSEGSGSGKMPGSYSAIVGEGGRTTVNNSFTCHENNDTNQQWNTITPWGGSATTTDPTVPVLVTEPNATCSSSCAVSLQWNASTAMSGAAVQYQVQVSSSSAFTTVNYSSGWISGTSWSVTLANGTWYWRVQARDSRTISKVSSWSSVGSFVLSNTPSTPPSIPVPFDVTNSSCSGPCAIGITWNPSTTTSGNDVQYSVQISSSSTFSAINYSSGWITGTSWSPTLATGTWYWRVQARDSVNVLLVSSWSVSDSFTVSSASSTAPPTAPVVIAEPDGYCSSYSGCSISLQWKPSTNPSGGSIQYLVQVSSSSSFSTIKYASRWQTSTDKSVTLARGTWYWRVEARDAAVNTRVSPWSSVDTFVLR